MARSAARARGDVATTRGRRCVREGLDVGQALLQIVVAPQVVHVPVQMHEPVAEPCHRLQGFPGLARQEALRDEHREAVGVVPGEPVVLRGDDMIRYIDATFDGYYEVILGVPDLVRVARNASRGVAASLRRTPR